MSDAKVRLYFGAGRLWAAYRNLLGEDLSEKRRAGRSIAPQDSQGYKHVLNRRMAVRPPIRGFRFHLHPRLSNVVHLRRTCSDVQDGRKFEICLKNEFL